MDPVAIRRRRTGHSTPITAHVSRRMTTFHYA
jgi:hypothetical protein